MKLFPAYLIKITVVCLVAGAAYSCMTEKGYECPTVLRLEFSYTNNPEGKELFSEEVNDIYLYLFDEQDNFRSSHIIEPAQLDQRRTITLEAEEGTYKAIAWANLDNRYFSVSENGSSRTTTISLNTDDQGETNGSTVDLFYGAATVVSTTNTNPTGRISFTKNTKTINVLFAGTKTRSVPGSDVSVRVTGTNGALDFENNTVATQPTTYRPNYSTMIYGNSLLDVAHFKVFKLNIGDDTKLQFYKNESLNTEQSLVELILEHFPHIKTNADLERYSEYTFIYEYDDESGLFVMVGIDLEEWEGPSRPGGI